MDRGFVMRRGEGNRDVRVTSAALFVRRPGGVEEPLGDGVRMLGKKVLVIEDGKDSLHAISELLRRAGHEVEAAQTGRQGLRLLQSDPAPDLVVLDSGLPDMTAHAPLSSRASDNHA